MAVPHSGIPAPDPAPQDATVDDLIATTVTAGTGTFTSLTAPHSGLTEVTADQHHAQSHGHTGADGSGTVAHSATTGRTANDHHNQAHVVTGADHTASGLTAGHVLRATGATTFAFGALADADVPATIARDTEVATAVSDHAALADPHAGYQKESERGTASGYAALDAATKVPTAQLGGSGASALNFLRGDQTWGGLPAPWGLVPDTGANYGSANPLGLANRGIIVPAYLVGPATLTGVRIRVGTASGNISVALYDSSLARVATSGVVVCPAGLADVSFSAGYAASPGRYWIGVSADNNTATFILSEQSANAGPLSGKYMETAHPLPATFTPAGITSLTVSMLGLISGGWAA